MHEGPGRESGPFASEQSTGDRLPLGRRGRGEATLLSGRRIRVNESLSRGAIEQAHCLQALVCRSGWSLRPLERGAERRALRAIPHGGGAGFPHVLLRGRNIRHVESPESLDRACKRETRTLPGTNTDVKAAQRFGCCSIVSGDAKTGRRQGERLPVDWATNDEASGLRTICRCRLHVRDVLVENLLLIRR
jgi:hypothetical protein